MTLPGATLALQLLLRAAPGAPAFEQEIQAACVDVEAIWPVPPELVRAVIRQESAFDPRAVSRVGAIGLMQVMPRNGAKVGISKEELTEPAKNILAGVRLLAAYLKHYDGDLISALVAYNAHPMRLGARIPDNGETPEYVRRVLRYFGRYQRALARGQMGDASANKDTSHGYPLASAVLARGARP